MQIYILGRVIRCLGLCMTCDAQLNLILGFYVLKPQSDYGTSCNRGFRVNFDHLGYQLHGTQVFLQSNGMRPSRP